mmetsp:Transcript_2819/g.7129  ORF Transcript_2819/g.7129 Transcript_2819/m.7129 type:complete len:81 (+) Transcript_2819:41-283(+)
MLIHPQPWQNLHVLDGKTQGLPPAQFWQTSCSSLGRSAADSFSLTSIKMGEPLRQWSLWSQCCNFASEAARSLGIAATAK